METRFTPFFEGGGSQRMALRIGMQRWWGKGNQSRCCGPMRRQVMGLNSLILLSNVAIALI